MQIVASDIGIFIWAAVLYYSIGKFGFLEVFKTYLVPYLWLVLFHSLILTSDVSFRR